VDLLPWADAYITKLFRDAHLLVDAYQLDPPALVSDTGTGGSADSPATMETSVLAGPARLVKDRLRPSASRQRRTAAAHWLVGCLG
jgi:hypothetical protein